MNKAEAVYLAPLKRVIERRQQQPKTRYGAVRGKENVKAAKRQGLRSGSGNPIPQASREGVQERSGGCCEAGVPACIEQPHSAHHMHHIAGRSNHSPENLLHVCNPAHAYIHAHPEESRRRGWMRSRLGTVRP